jgi:hypothetical protein
LSSFSDNDSSASSRSCARIAGACRHAATAARGVLAQIVPLMQQKEPSIRCKPHGMWIA